MLTQEQKDKVINAIKHCELYYVDQWDDLSNLSSDWWLELIRDWYLSEDITMNWDCDITWIMDEAYKALDIEDRDDDDLRYEIQDLIYEHCSNDPMPQLLRNTRHQNIVHVLGDIDDIELPTDVEDSEEFAEGDLQTFRTGILLGRTLDEMIEMFRKVEDNWKTSEYRKYYSIHNEGFGYTKLCVAYQMDADDIPKIHTSFTNGDKVKLRNWDVGVINNSEGSGWMDTNTFLVDPVFTFDINQCYHDKAMGRYGYYDQVVGDDADHGQIIVVEKATVPLVTEDPLAAMRAVEAAYELAYKNWGCTFGDTKYDRHRNSKYINEYPCGTHCMDCSQFWID